MKVCSTCHEELDLSEFYKESSSRDGHARSCKECSKERARKWRKENKRRVQEVQKSYRSSNKLAIKAKEREWRQANKDHLNSKVAKRNAMKLELTTEDVDYSIIRQRDTYCYLCGVEFSKKEKSDTKLTHVDHIVPLSRTELNPTHSYENVALTHAACNLSKRGSTPEEYWSKL